MCLYKTGLMNFSIAMHAIVFKPRVNLHIWMVGRNPEYSERTHGYTRRTCTRILSAQKDGANYYN